jgi:cell wall-associated NlpC family hydrolase
MDTFFCRVLLWIFLGASVVLTVRADGDSGLTGGDAVAAPAKTVAHPKHKKKAAVSAAVSASTNAVVSPVTATHDVAVPASETGTNTVSVAAEAANVPASDDGRVASLAVSDLQDFDSDPPEVRRLLEQALALTTQNLTYKYGSDDPREGGMDCSGTVYYLLGQAGAKDAPRDASEMYRWVWERGEFRSVLSSNPETFELAKLKPGDLLFWSGTYHVERDPPVTHVMIYLGINRATGRRVMVGASEGRRFNGKSRYGVSVFDFTLPGSKSAGETASGGAGDLQARFVGYGSIPGLATEATSRSSEQ